MRVSSAVPVFFRVFCRLPIIRSTDCTACTRLRKTVSICFCFFGFISFRPANQGGGSVGKVLYAAVRGALSPGNRLASVGRRAFLDYWPIRRFSTEPERIYRSFRWGQALELFVLDVRQYRDLNRGTMLGKAQKEWLLSGISNSTSTFKFVATTVPMAGGGSDRWDGFPKEREEILRYINNRKLRGVVFLSGDMHYAAITKIPRSGGLKDITAGPLAAPLNRVTDGTARRYEYYLAENFNFAKITVDPMKDRNQALVEFVDQDNRIFHTAKLSAG